MKNESKAVIGINLNTGEKKVFGSINEAAREAGVNFQQVQIAMLSGGRRKDWRFYPTAENIRGRIADLEKMLDIVEG